MPFILEEALLLFMGIMATVAAVFILVVMLINVPWILMGLATLFVACLGIAFWRNR